MHQISDAIWQSQIRSRHNPEPHAFGEAIGERPTLLVFLRHFG